MLVDPAVMGIQAPEMFFDKAILASQDADSELHASLAHSTQQLDGELAGQIQDTSKKSLINRVHHYIDQNLIDTMDCFC